MNALMSNKKMSTEWKNTLSSMKFDKDVRIHWKLGKLSIIQKWTQMKIIDLPA